MAKAPRHGNRRRRSAHYRYRAPRVAPHRQPAARAGRPPGRSRLVALLPVAGGSVVADFRRRPREVDHAAAENAGRRGDRELMGVALDRIGPAQGRGAQLRYQEAAARVRRRRQRPAQGHLRAEKRIAGKRRRQRDHHLAAPGRGERYFPCPYSPGERGGAMGCARPGEGFPGRTAVLRSGEILARYGLQPRRSGAARKRGCRSRPPVP